MFSFVITCLLIASQHHDCVFLSRWKCNRNSGCRICIKVCPHFEWIILCLFMSPIVSWWSQRVVVAACPCTSWWRWWSDTSWAKFGKVMSTVPESFCCYNFSAISKISWPVSFCMCCMLLHLNPNQMSHILLTMDIIPRARRDPLDGTIHGREKTEVTVYWNIKLYLRKNKRFDMSGLCGEC